jgi:hypothetical protein
VTTPDITATIVFHREGAFAIPALASLGDLVAVARATGLVVETQAILDRPDELTRHIVAVRGAFLDTVHEVSFGDPGKSRNAGTDLAHGRFLAFLDGDDLWGEQWLRAAYKEANAPLAPAAAVWHPECLYCFSESDFDRHSLTGMPHLGAHSFHILNQPSDMPGFNHASLAMNYVWTSNVFATRELHLRYPYNSGDPSRGFGIEDWSWNLKTTWDGIPHRVVPGTVHVIRIKQTQSRGQQNVAQSLLPIMPPSFIWGPKA